MDASSIVIKIYNYKTLRVDLGEKMIRDYAMNVAKEAYIRGWQDAQDGISCRPEMSLSEMNPDNANRE